MASLLLLMLAALSGCAATGPLVAPSQQRFLVDPEPRTLGPLRPASESDVRIVKTGVPVGTRVAIKSAIDMDAMMRVGDERRSVDVRITTHDGRVRQIQRLDAEGPNYRFRIDFLHDETITLVNEERKRETGPVHRKGYIMDVGPGGADVHTLNADMPRLDEEVDVVLKEAGYFPAAEQGGPSGPPITSESVTDTLREALSAAGVEIRDAKASFKGVREIAGVPCAVFHVTTDGVMRKVEPDKSMALEMRVSGEYAFRLTDGLEAELFLTGTMLITGELHMHSTLIPLRAAGHVRIHVAATVREPNAPPGTQRDALHPHPRRRGSPRS
jgi:hypothetical protein